MLTLQWREAPVVKNKDGPANKVHLTSTEDIQDKTFIGIRKLHILEKNKTNH